MGALRIASSIAAVGPYGFTLTLKSQTSAGRIPSAPISSSTIPPCARSARGARSASERMGHLQRAADEQRGHGRGRADDAPRVGDLGEHRRLRRIAQAVAALLRELDP